METIQAGMPTWYRVWRILLGITVVVMLVCVSMGIPAALVASHIRADTNRLQLMEMVTIWAVGLPLYAFLAIGIGLVILVAGLIIGVIVTLLRPRGKRANRSGLARTILGFLIITFVTGGVLIFGALDLSIWQFESQMAGSCVPPITMVTFVDENRNGIRDINERGLRGVNGMTTVSRFRHGDRMDETFSFVTDLEGERLVPVSADVTRSNLIGQPPIFCELKHVMVAMDAVEGFSATTQTQCGAFFGQYSSGNGTIICYAGYAPNR